MPTLPLSDSSLLVRTHFGSDEGWWRVSAEATGSNEEGFRAYVTPVTDSAFDGPNWEEVKAAEAIQQDLAALHDG